MNVMLPFCTISIWNTMEGQTSWVDTVYKSDATDTHVYTPLSFHEIVFPLPEEEEYVYEYDWEYGAYD